MGSEGLLGSLIPGPVPTRHGLSPSSTAVDEGRGLRSIPLPKDDPMKTIIFFTAKRARTPKMQGLASAAGSASIIRELCRLAKAGKGRVYLVDAPTAEHGRRRIAAFRAGEKPDIGAPPMTTVLDNGRVVGDRGQCLSGTRRRVGGNPPLGCAAAA